jgi:hypothetical protein
VLAVLWTPCAGRESEGGSSVYGEALGLAAQNVGRTGPISPAPGGSPWASLLGVALLLAGISVAVAAVSVRYGMRRLSRGWAASFLLFSLIAAYSLWRLA